MSTKGNYISLEASLRERGILEGVLRMGSMPGPFTLQEVGISGQNNARNLQKKELIIRAGRIRRGGNGGIISRWVGTDRLRGYLQWRKREGRGLE